ncbi:thioredoxin family protein [Sulfurimonas sp.]|uniref:thioredoxin family protein n=1 Tax=Sulfurimonas sp. TaxID=2022749 RepID=UPI0025D1D7DF|nr:thioredoxin family protein [Sulfurimonas sp.]
MKILLSLLLFFTFAFSAQLDKFASEVNYSRNYNSALKLAKEQNKLLMLVVVGDYCPWCKKFERKTLSSSLIKNKVSKDFIPLIIDKINDKGKYPDKFYSKYIPTVHFVNPKTQNTIFETLGYMKKKEFAQNMNSALKSYKEGNTNVDKH